MSTEEAVKNKIVEAIVNEKGNACPLAVRLAWHSAVSFFWPQMRNKFLRRTGLSHMINVSEYNFQGTYDSKDGSGGSNGATMRFAPESTDGANAGLDNHARHALASC
jgi:catalase (peroxidase I)